MFRLALLFTMMSAKRLSKVSLGLALYEADVLLPSPLFRE